VIRDANKQKRLDFARKYRDDTFDVIWTDECTVQMEGHRRFCCHKRGEAPSLSQGLFTIVCDRVK